jgi:hypothetical protein
MLQETVLEAEAQVRQLKPAAKAFKQPAGPTPAVNISTSQQLERCVTESDMKFSLGPGE